MERRDDLTPEARRLLRVLAVLPEAAFPHRVMPGEVATSLGFAPARAWRLFRELWTRGYYEYDISAYSGHVTEAGRLAASEEVLP